MEVCVSTTSQDAEQLQHHRIPRVVILQPHLPLSWASLIAQLVKNPSANAGDPSSIPGLGRFPGEEKGYPLQYSGLENSMNSFLPRSLAPGHLSTTFKTLSIKNVI